MRDGPSRPAVLIADDDPAARAAARRALEPEFEVHAAASAAAALATLAEEWVHVLYAAGREGGLDGAALCAETRARWPEIVTLLAAGGAPDAEAADLLLHSEPEPESLRRAARLAARHFRLAREHDRLRLESTRLRRARPAPDAALCRGFDRLLRAPHSPMEAVCRRAAQVASFDVPALLLGETGVGKEVLARAIHDGSLRADRPFQAVHCGAIPDELLEAELFGHRRGAFTGAHADREGLLAKADGGTVFLDEIGDTSPAFQVKLLRFLQEGEIRPVGANETRHVDVRVIAATHRDLRALAAEGRFRDDLYWRLAVAVIETPPLRDRPEDVAPLAEGLLARLMAAHGKRVRGFEPLALARLSAHDWPGNVRELENEVLRLLMDARGDWLAAEDLSPGLRRACAPAPGPRTAGGTLRDRVERLEAEVIAETLARCGGNKSRAAEALGLSRVGLRAKLDRLNIDTPSAVAAQ